MSKKFSIVKQIDFKKLDRIIDDYKQETGKYPYIFVNRETIKAMFTYCSDTFTENYIFSIADIIAAKNSNYYKIGSYKGLKLFPNDDLEFGEVELR